MGGNSMKILFAVSLTFALVFAFLPGFFASADEGKSGGIVSTEPQAAVSQKQALPEGFDDAKVWEKIDPALQQAYRDAMGAGDRLRRFDCFVRDQNRIDDGDRSFLISKGFNVRTVGGNVASGYLKAQDLPLVARLPFVVSIKLSKRPGNS